MGKDNEIRTGRFRVFNMHVHLVFVTRYREKVLDRKAIEILRESFGGICRKSAAERIETNGAEDHVPLLVFYPPKIAVSALVNSPKGASFRILRKRYPGIAKRYDKGKKTCACVAHALL